MSETTKKAGADSEHLVENVRDRYSKIATGDTPGGCCSTASTSAAVGYSAEDLAVLPDGANLGLGCGAPLTFLDLKPGEVVVDLGAGAGIDAFLAARAVGPEGRVIGVDMTEDMIEKAREHASEAGLTQVEFRLGRLEALPVDDASVDAVTSNCVINLVPDKAAVFREIARVLKPGGRLVISDIVLDGDLPAVVLYDVLAYTGCISGAEKREAYFATLEAAGLGDITIHKDVDYVSSTGYVVEDELQAKLAAAGISVSDLDGVVRSVTFGARR